LKGASLSFTSLRPFQIASSELLYKTGDQRLEDHEWQQDDKLLAAEM
jgi:hypothetical protein